MNDKIFVLRSARFAIIPRLILRFSAWDSLPGSDPERRRDLTAPLPVRKSYVPGRFDSLPTGKEKTPAGFPVLASVSFILFSLLLSFYRAVVSSSVLPL
jgi:hypothetical protein